MKLRALTVLIVIGGMALMLFLPRPGAAQQRETLQGLDFDCLQTMLRNCRVLTAGYINGAAGEDEGAPMLAWQTQSGFTHETGVASGFVLFRFGADGWELLDAGFDGAGFQLPVLNEAGLLHIPGYGGGTGAHNVDRLYELDGTWRRVDLDAWRSAIDPLLPPGLEIWKGVDYDFENPWSGLVARTPLWRADDGNCCPSGGSAVIGFDIVDRALVITGVAYTPPGPD